METSTAAAFGPMLVTRYLQVDLVKRRSPALWIIDEVQ